RWFLPSCGADRLRRILRSRRPKRSHHLMPKAIDPAPAGKLDQFHRATLPGLETHRGTGGDVQAVAIGDAAIELERRIGLEEVVVRSDLDRPVAGIGHLDADCLASRIQYDLAVVDQELAWD